MAKNCLLRCLLTLPFCVHTKEPCDPGKHFIGDRDLICIESRRGKVDIRAKITGEVKPGILSSTFHFPDMMLNNITSSISDSEAMCPEYKVVACTIRKSKGKYQLKKMNDPIIARIIFA